VPPGAQPLVHAAVQQPEASRISNRKFLMI
jgi:hypothetical protein